MFHFVSSWLQQRCKLASSPGSLNEPGDEAKVQAALSANRSGTAKAARLGLLCWKGSSREEVAYLAIASVLSFLNSIVPTANPAIMLAGIYGKPSGGPDSDQSTLPF